METHTSRYALTRVAPYTVGPCSSLKAQQERDAARHSSSIFLGRGPRTCQESGGEECYRVLALGSESGSSPTVVADHLTKESADHMREERLALVNREICAGCGEVFDQRRVPDGHPIGNYGQYCSGQCRDRKELEIRELALHSCRAGQVVLVVEERYCYLVTNNGVRKADRSGHHGFKVLTEERGVAGWSGPCYCFLDRDGSSLLALRLCPLLRIALTVEDSYSRSLEAVMGLALDEGVLAPPFGVGEVPIVVDRRRAAGEEPRD